MTNVEKLYYLIIYFVFLESGYSENGEPYGIVVLFTNYPHKYSCHIHWKFNGAVWRSNVDFGNWIKELIELKNVYTKNRNFRLHGNTKYGKNSNLYLDEGCYDTDDEIRDHYIPLEHLKMDNKNIFLASLITNIPIVHCDSKVLSYECIVQQKQQTSSSPQPVATQEISVSLGDKTIPSDHYEGITSILDEVGNKEFGKKCNHSGRRWLGKTN
ncbi:hypothetical protein DICPUDRAFT_159721 [Dictyostelium purpureum]|uniref:DNA-directed primase/polymerase protein n=1 Tax=Dictyostelium purpureum TaxID=5786 RepID=F1A4U1_DICPU|nr:uncharacterized protein DICPUDRAFT_159721 [Dictyostelium purpureum]EGC28789.1 hypothetical protein DICPUDRAFT_159721 [Dictyostelium purpureum]|eukprot:XP_003294684.1 hypothetical protein DICPUDRAFT_159721 [Dictyostelium purpureum]